MNKFSRLQKYLVAGAGIVGGGALFYYTSYGNFQNAKTFNSWTTNFEPSVKWDYNWDRRQPKSLVKPMKILTEEDENRFNEKCDAKKSKAVRHIFLVRHGQYRMDGKTDAEMILTDLGREQAKATGQRLALLNFPYTSVVKSTMARAQETSGIIEKFLPSNLPVQSDSLLEEGAPIPPEPPIGNWKSEYHFFRDGPRIEAAFRKYFHRAEESQKTDTYTVVVCHANVIRYFVCRALQFPPEAWLRISLSHASITRISIHPSGKVSIYCMGDAGHMPPEKITYH